MSTTFRSRRAGYEHPTSFEAGSLPLLEKQRLCEELLGEFGLRVHSHSSTRHELVIPCDLGEHRNQHSDPTGALNYKKLTFKCLGCQRSGGLLWFISEHRDGSTDEARQWLGKETGTDGQVQELPALLRYFDSLYPEKVQREQIKTFSPKILDPWMLIHPWVVDPVEEGGRAIPEANVVKFKVGYAPEFKYQFIKETESWVTSERIVIPHFWKGDLVGWQTRRLDKEDGTAKYKSSTDFPKDTTIFNYDPEGHDNAVVVEGMFSTIKHDHHTHMVSTFGANLTERQIKLLGRYRRLYFWLDNDKAGWSAYEGLYDNRGRQTKMGVLEACSKYTDVWVVDSSLDADPGDLDDGTVRRHKESAVPWVVWKRPTRLLCHRCGERAHEGGCG